jgi:hypothetical protein
MIEFFAGMGALLFATLIVVGLVALLGWLATLVAVAAFIIGGLFVAVALAKGMSF